MQIFVFNFKVKPQSGYLVSVKVAYANVYIKAGNLIEARLRAQIVLKESHFDILEMRKDGEAYDPLHDDPHPIAAHFLQKAQEDGVAIFISGVGVDPDGAGTQN